MGDSRIDSQGFSVGRWRFPAFTLRGGESITLCFPKEARVDQEPIVASLIGSEPVSGLAVCAKVAFADPTLHLSGWRQWLFRSTPLDWMKQNTALSDDAIASFLDEHHMDRRVPISRYAGTPRMILRLAAAYARKPDVLVFSTAGLDRLGVRSIFQFVSEHLPECSAIYLAWPFLSQGQVHCESFPDSLSIPVIDTEGTPAPGMASFKPARLT
jgi:hypothetical protein